MAESVRTLDRPATMQTVLTTATPRPARRRFLREWLPLVTLGELVGFGIPALAGSISYGSSLSDVEMAGPLIVAGAAQGGIFGMTQAAVLRRYLRDFDPRAWVVATALAASIAWALSMVLVVAGDRIENAAAMAVIAVAVAPLIVLSLGGAQFLLLRDYLDRGWRWVAWNALAWAAALPVSIGVISAVPNGAPAFIFVLAGVLGGALMGGVVATVTGFGLSQMLFPETQDRASGRTTASLAAPGGR